MARPRSTTITVRYAPHARRVKSWGAFWREPHPLTGKRRDVSEFFATEADAHAFKAKHEAHAAALPPPPPPLKPAPTAKPIPATAGDLATEPGTFHEFAERWLTTIAARKKQATQRSYRGLLETHVYPTLGGVRVKAIDTETVVQVITSRAAAGVSWGTQKAIIRVVSSCLRWAVRYKHLAHNPCLQLTKDLRDDSAGDYEDPEPNPLTADQAHAFLTWIRTGVVIGAPKDRPVDGPRGRGGRVLEGKAGFPDLYPYFLALVETGMRRGEAAALKWTTVYLERPVPMLRIDRSDSPSARAAGQGDTTTKSKRGRDVAIAPALAEALRELARTRKARAFAVGRNVSPYVFVTARGARLLSDASTAERVFDRGMAAIGLEAAGHTIHDLRDTFATLHLAANPGKLAWISAMLGHRHVSTTLNRYTKWIPSMTGTDAIAGLMPTPAAADAK